MSVFLCFDFGTKRIGVAVGQSITGTANPLPHLTADQGIPRWEHIAKLIQAWKPKTLIVGLPLNMDGTEQAITELAKQFMQQLEMRYQLPVKPIDERLSSVAARELLFEEGGYRALKKGYIDSIAAAILLESWMRENI